MLRQKELIYGSQANVGLVGLLGRAEGRVLDLGCGSGAMAPALRSIGATTVVGADPSEAACRLAECRYDIVAVSGIEDLELSQIGGERFNVAVIADVLEHLIDPWAALAKVRGWMAPQGRVAISTPNLAYFEILRRLLLRDEFCYSPEGGVMDETHLRWFTRTTMDAALKSAGFSPEAHGGSWGPRRSKIARPARGRLDRFLLHQIYVIGRAQYGGQCAVP